MRIQVFSQSDFPAQSSRGQLGWLDFLPGTKILFKIHYHQLFKKKRFTVQRKEGKFRLFYISSREPHYFSRLQQGSASSLTPQEALSAQVLPCSPGGPPGVLWEPGPCGWQGDQEQVVTVSLTTRALLWKPRDSG